MASKDPQLDWIAPLIGRQVTDCPGSTAEDRDQAIRPEPQQQEAGMPAPVAVPHLDGHGIRQARHQAAVS